MKNLFGKVEMEKMYSAFVSIFGENVDWDTKVAQFFNMRYGSKNDFDSDLQRFIQICCYDLEMLSRQQMVWNYDLDRKNCLKELHSIGVMVNEIPKGSASLWEMCPDVKTHNKAIDILQRHYFLVDQGEPCDYCDICYAGHYGV